MQNAYSADIDEKMRSIRSFEGMYNMYEQSARQKDLCIKKVYDSIRETHLLYSRGDILIFAIVDHKGATREAIEIGKQILADAKEIESTSFIMRHI